jgi:hypothetical protein
MEDGCYYGFGMDNVPEYIPYKELEPITLVQFPRSGTGFW